eukprot:gene15132-16688_t
MFATCTQDVKEEENTEVSGVFGDLNGNYRKLPPIKPEHRPKNDNRENARIWRRKKLLSSSSKHSTGKSSTGKPRPEEKKIKKDGPVPMKQRAFPESFWHEPEAMQTSSLAGGPYTVLPPLFSSGTSDSMDITEIRPPTPPGQGGREGASRYMTAPPNTELLFSLFDKFSENKVDDRLIVRRGRPRKQIASDSLVHKQPSSKRDEDPYMVDSLSEKLFPQLSLGGSTPTNAAPKFAVLKLPTGERTIELPAIQQAPTNYSAMLNELASLL